jgi:hypothetical protein
VAEVKASVVVELVDRLSRGSRGIGNSLGAMSRASSRHLGALRRAAGAAGGAIDRLGNRYTALATGAGAVGTLRFLIGLEQRFVRLGIQANISAEKVDKIKNKIFEVSQSRGIRIDPGELTSAIEVIVEKTGDLAFAMENAENIAQTIQGTGGQGGTIGALTAEFRKFGLTTQQEVAGALDVLVTQGKAGAFTVANLAGQGERLAASYAATGRQGPIAVREMGAVIQVIRQGTGSAEMAATAFEAVIRTLTDAEKLKLLKRNGIQVFEPDQPGVMRSIADIMAEIVESTGGDLVKISTIFDAEAMRAFTAASAEFKQSGSLASLEKFLNIQADGTALQEDSARAANTAAGAIRNLASAFQQFADANLTAPIQGIADALNAIEPDKLQTILKVAGIGALGLGGLILGRKMGRGLGFGRGAGAGAAGGLGAAVGGFAPTPVVVMNWPGGSMSPIGGGSGGGRGRGGGRGGGGRFGKLGRAGGALGRGLGRAFVPLAAMLAGYDAFSALTDESLSGSQKLNEVAGAGGGLAGGLAGAAAGAAIGSAFPVVGTAIGGLVGGGIGYMGGDELARAIADAITGTSEKQEIDMTVRIAGSGRAILDRVNAQPGINVDVDSGLMMEASP